MSLLQYAAENLTRMVVYWVAYERSYLEFSPRAKALIETGENMFFVRDQDADAFFQRLMRELGEGQPSWIADPIQALVLQGDGLKFEADREISGLVDDHRQRVNYAVKHRVPEDSKLIDALQARSEGDYEKAIKLLAPILQRGRRYKRLYAQSLQDAFDNDPDENGERIDTAIEQFGQLLARGRGADRFQDAVSLIEALFDKHSTSPDAELSPEGRANLARVVRVIGGARKRLSAAASTDRALLDFYEARAIQELADKGGDAPRNRSVIQAYQGVVDRLAPATSEMGLDAQDGLAQALVALSDARLELAGQPADADVEEMRCDLSKAIEIHTGLVQFAWHNSPSPSFAGALENLASDYAVLARLTKGSPQAGDALRGAAEALGRAVSARRLAGEGERAAEVEARLEEIRERLRG